MTASRTLTSTEMTTKLGLKGNNGSLQNVNTPQIMQKTRQLNQNQMHSQPLEKRNDIKYNKKDFKIGF